MDILWANLYLLDFSFDNKSVDQAFNHKLIVIRHFFNGCSVRKGGTA